MSPKDICFPARRLPVPIPNAASHKQYVQRLQDTLEGLRFRALDGARENKQQMREAHDLRRVEAEPSLPAHAIQVGDVVAVYQPKPTLPKLSFQWSAPDHVVVSVESNTCKVRSLVNKGGASLSKIKKDNSLPSRTVNKKMLSSYPVSDSFFLGAQVYRKFGKKWFPGTVDQTSADEGESVWRVTYSDFDSEEVDKQGLASILIYHPLLDAHSDIQVPEVESLVWFSKDQQPQLGRVLEVDPSSPRPLSVRLYVPLTPNTDLVGARYMPAVDPENDQPIIQRLTMPQVVLRLDKDLTKRGYLQASDRRRLGRLIQY